ncbi:MAG: hypothetical protein H6502_02575 [Candidatus Woesearchaeota archaeon]|nr:MAG: hypothetical protein H6502_02575 [Candidatus Woesearchaeota archaeon]
MVRRGLLFIFCLVVVFTLSSFASASCSPPATGTWTIGVGNHTNCTGVHTNLSGSLIVAGQLTMDNSTFWFPNASAGLNVSGILDMYNESVIFNTTQNVSVTGSLNVSNSTFGTTKITVYGTANFTNAVFLPASLNISSSNVVIDTAIFALGSLVSVYHPFQNDVVSFFLSNLVIYNSTTITLNRTVFSLAGFAATNQSNVTLVQPEFISPYAIALVHSNATLQNPILSSAFDLSLLSCLACNFTISELVQFNVTNASGVANGSYVHVWDNASTLRYNASINATGGLSNITSMITLFYNESQSYSLYGGTAKAFDNHTHTSLNTTITIYNDSIVRPIIIPLTILYNPEGAPTYTLSISDSYVNSSEYVFINVTANGETNTTISSVTLNGTSLTYNATWNSWWSNQTYTNTTNLTLALTDRDGNVNTTTIPRIIVDDVQPLVAAISVRFSNSSTLLCTMPAQSTCLADVDEVTAVTFTWNFTEHNLSAATVFFGSAVISSSSNSSSGSLTLPPGRYRIGVNLLDQANNLYYTNLSRFTLSYPLNLTNMTTRVAGNATGISFLVGTSNQSSNASRDPNTTFKISALASAAYEFNMTFSGLRARWNDFLFNVSINDSALSSALAAQGITNIENVFVPGLDAFVDTADYTSASFRLLRNETYTSAYYFLNETYFFPLLACGANATCYEQNESWQQVTLSHFSGVAFGNDTRAPKVDIGLVGGTEIDDSFFTFPFNFSEIEPATTPCVLTTNQTSVNQYTLPTANFTQVSMTTRTFSGVYNDLRDGDLQINVTCTDANGNSNRSTVLLLVNDTTAPDFVQEPTTTKSTTTAETTFTTNEYVKITLYYGLTNATTHSAVDTTYEVNHEIDWTNLNTSTKYYYKIRLYDRNGNSYLSDLYQFTTRAPSSSPTPSGGDDPGLFPSDDDDDPDEENNTNQTAPPVPDITSMQTKRWTVGTTAAPLFWRITNATFPVTNISIYLRSNLSSTARLNITHLNKATIPTTILARISPFISIHYLSFDLEHANMSRADVHVRVAKSNFNATLLPTDFVVYHVITNASGTAVSLLPSAHIGEDALYHYFWVGAPSFSDLLLGIKRPAPPASNSGFSGGSDPDTSGSGSSVTGAIDSSQIVGIIIVACALVLLGVMYGPKVAKKLSESKVKQEVVATATEPETQTSSVELSNEQLVTLNQYILKALEAGHQPDEIRHALLGVGWDAPTVDKAIETMKKLSENEETGHVDTSEA